MMSGVDERMMNVEHSVEKDAPCIHPTVSAIYAPPNGRWTCDTCGAQFQPTPVGPAPMMDRPAYELVRLIEAELDDGDQLTDTPQRPNLYTIWGIRALLEPYGGKPHRWQWPHCFECGHQSPLHNYGPCDLCGCALTPEEVVAGARDEALDEDILRALQQDYESRRPLPPGEPA